jgi:hypothetical protein
VGNSAYLQNYRKQTEYATFCSILKRDQKHGYTMMFTIISFNVQKRHLRFLKSSKAGTAHLHKIDLKKFEKQNQNAVGHH